MNTAPIIKSNKVIHLEKSGNINVLLELLKKEREIKSIVSIQYKGQKIILKRVGV